MTRTRQKQDNYDDNAPGVSLTNQTKALITELSFQLAGVNKPQTLEDFLLYLEESGFTVPLKTLKNWRKYVKDDPTHFYSEHRGGSHLLLTKEHELLWWSW